MAVTEEIECKIAKDRTVIIKAVSPQISLKEPLYAVNWFDTKSKILYNLYNLLASKSVYKVGGKAIFKGIVLEKIQGKQEDHREMLLIVKYPSAYSFKSLIDSLYFKLVSILRIKAVLNFNFGFTKVYASSYKQIEDKAKTYAIHHLEGMLNEEQLNEL